MVDSDVMTQLIDGIRRYARERLVPIEQQVDENDEIPEEIVQDLRAMGLFGLTTPTEYGGLGLDASAEAELVMELCWASAAFRSLFGINAGIGSQGILMDGTDAQKREWLPSIASGETIVSFCLTEPGSGSDAAALVSTAVKEGGCYVINGSKRFITNAPRAGLFIVMARTSPERMPHNAHVSAFLVPADTPGITVGPHDRKMGQRGAWSADVFFEDVRVPESALFGGVEGRGFATAMKSLDRGRVNIAAVCVGQARRLLHEATSYAVERHQFGKPIGEFQLIQALLADSQAELLAAEALVRATAQAIDAGGRQSVQAACCKMFCSEMVGRIADRAVQILGGSGYIRGSAIERMYRDARVFRIYEGTTQILQTVIGRDLVKQHA